MSPVQRETQAQVAEFQGLYGAYSVSEVLLQKLWLRGEFDLSRARTLGGEPVRIRHPGTWNRIAGPDFHAARLEIGDRMITGDVEVHFQAEAWTQHGHHADPAYDDVALHVVLFPPRPGAPPARTHRGREIPTLVLVDLLWHDLEEYASDEAVAALGGRDPFPIVEELLALAPAARAAVLHEAGARRWREKVHFAGLRVQRVGWEQAAHLSTLEILGYRANRVAMMRVGEQFPWPAWRGDVPSLDELVAAAAEWWTLRGVRPANQPRRRLAQYRGWTARVADWPARARAWKPPVLPQDAAARGAADLRKQVRLPRVRAAIAQQLCGGEFGGTRLDTWLANFLFPFVAAVRPDEAPTMEALWHVWPPGDAPAALLTACAQLTVPAVGPARTNGLVQGLLGLQLARHAGLPPAER